MARIAGIDLRIDKRIEIALTDIYGIGRVRANEILQSAKVDPDTRVRDLTEQEVSRVRQILDRGLQDRGPFEELLPATLGLEQLLGGFPHRRALRVA